MTTLSQEERQFYARHLSIRQFGEAAQLALKNARVLVVGAGGLGCPILQYLAAAGVGYLGIVEADHIDVSNLQRQVLYDFDDCGKSKAHTAKANLQAANPYIQVVVHDCMLDVANAVQLIEQYDVVVDGSDNFRTKFLVNDACWFAGKPLVFGSIYQFEGQVSVFNMADDSAEGRGPNYRDLFPAPPPPELAPNCAEAGVLGIVPGIVGCFQANEVIKLITGIGAPLSGRLLLVDALDGSTSTLELRKAADNRLSGQHRTIVRLQAEEKNCALDARVQNINVEELIALCQHNKVQLLDVRDLHERQRYSLGGMHIPLTELENHPITLKKGQVLLVYCESGKRSAIAARKLSERLATAPIYQLTGGMQAVLRGGYPVDSLTWFAPA